MFPTLPPRPLLRTIATRIAIVFLALRVTAAALGTAVELDPMVALQPSVAGVIWTWGAVVLALRIDLARRAELVLLANLGYSFRRIGALAVVGCALLEVATRSALFLLEAAPRAAG